MWLSRDVVSWFHIAKESVDALREELASVRAERDTLRNELTSTKITSDWLRVQCNQLQVENKALLQKAYGISIPVPEIVRHREPELFKMQDLFSHIEDNQEAQ